MRQKSRGKRAERRRQMVGNNRENDAYSYHRCLSVFKILNAYIFEKFIHFLKNAFFPFLLFSFLLLLILLPICLFFFFLPKFFIVSI